MKIFCIEWTQNNPLIGAKDTKREYYVDEERADMRKADLEAAAHMLQNVDIRFAAMIEIEVM